MNTTERNAEQARRVVTDPRWASVIARDATADGRFVFSVRTTGVYCRPSCAARRARPENVQFHATGEDAERAGFRPCRRCRPDRPSLIERHAAQVTRACRTIESAEHIPSLASLAADAGMSAWHFHRVFKSITGVTPRAYAQARLADRTRRELSRAGSVTDALYEAGYNSSGRFYANSDARLGMTPSTYRAGGAATRIRFAVGECFARFHPGRRKRAGYLRDPARRRSRSARATVAGRVPEG